MIHIKIIDKELYDEEALRPKTRGSAGIDLKVSKIVELNNHLMICTGISVTLNDPSLVGLVYARSSVPVTLVNSVGVIDSDYQGEIILNAHKGTLDKYVKWGSRVAQLVIQSCLQLNPADYTIVANHDVVTDRGDKGFGSTGSK